MRRCSCLARTEHVLPVNPRGQRGVEPGRPGTEALCRPVPGAGHGVRMIFLGFFRGIGLTKLGNGCILYSTGSKKDWCSPQNGTALNRESAWSGLNSEEKSKNLSKVA